jgi:hypothetical protein
MSSDTLLKGPFLADFPITKHLPVRLTIQQAKTRFFRLYFEKINQFGGLHGKQTYEQD